jgi:hypothetical protein
VIKGLQVLVLLAPGMAFAGIAAAAGGPVTATVTPNTAGSASGVSISITGPLPPGLPTSLEFTVQPGFTTSIKSVSVLCSAPQAGQDQCPAASQVGTGQLVTNSLGTINLTLALAAPQQQGDVASVFLIGSIAGYVLDLPARLFVPSGGGIELLLENFPQLPIPSLQISSLSLNATAMTTVTATKIRTVTTGKGRHKKRKKVKTTTKTTYSLITNPSTCPATGYWTGSVLATFSSTGPKTIPFQVVCSPLIPPRRQSQQLAPV